MRASCVDRDARAPRWIAALALLVWLVVPTSARAQDVWDRAAAIVDALDNWQIRSAAGALEALEAEAPEHPAVWMARAELHFHRGAYDAAVEAFDRARTLDPTGALAGRLEPRRALAESTARTVKGYARYVTRDGHFEILYDPRQDDVLLPWAEETLEAAYHEIGYELGFWPEAPIRVEVFPRASTLAAVSTLSEEAIRTSGVIALCKYNKLMFTSPRATLRGYGWRDTMSHEYVHYVIAHMVGERVPIWLHEAIAKYLEARWTGVRQSRLDPSVEDLLGRRIADRKLITFEQMHPSMAYLPSPEDAATAYAQVFTVMEYIGERRGRGFLRELLADIGRGTSADAAVANLLDESFRTFERRWTAWLTERPRVEVPGEFREEKLLVPEKGTEPAADALAGVDSTEARDFLHLGELLRARDQAAAALVEYEKAEALLGRANPVLQNALATVYLEMNRPDAAISAVDEVRRWHPDYYPSHLARARALVALERWDEAAAALDEAIGINPFDPAVHRAWAAVFRARGDAAREAQSLAFARKVSPTGG